MTNVIDPLRDRRVWFRNGVRSSSSGDNENLAKGTKWLEMVGEMHMITLGIGDQVPVSYFPYRVSFSSVSAVHFIQLFPSSRDATIL